MKGVFVKAGLVALVALALASGAAARPSAATTLRGTVGPGFTITLKTQNGAAVKTLKPGTYTIVVRDRSPIHNFHLSGPRVNKATSVVKTGRTTWTVRFTRGTYRFRCDPHRTLMHGSFLVS
jgi:plastocyanin